LLDRVIIISMKKILVSGVNGFVGKHLLREIVSRGHKAYGVGREETAHPEISSILSGYFIADLTRSEDVANLPLDEIDTVISLAGLARAGDSFKEPEKYLKINVDVASVLANEILSRNLPVRFIAISTGAAYDSNQSMPLTEESKLIENGSPYAKSKILMENALEKLRTAGLECVIVRPLNHIGPGQESGFLVPDLYQKIITAMQGAGNINVGDLTTKRDYTDVRDVAVAYVNLAEAGNLKYNLYNVCSGKSVAGEEILKTLLEEIGSSTQIKIEQDKALIRPNDPKDLYGSNKRISEATGWQPTIPLSKTIADFVAYQKLII
jgi:GDP-4-dehydro-6-deoxy-D-mannose reductase